MCSSHGQGGRFRSASRERERGVCTRKCAGPRPPRTRSRRATHFSHTREGGKSCAPSQGTPPSEALGLLAVTAHGTSTCILPARGQAHRGHAAPLGPGNVRTPSPALAFTPALYSSAKSPMEEAQAPRSPQSRRRRLGDPATALARSCPCDSPCFLGSPRPPPGALRPLYPLFLRPSLFSCGRLDF